MACVDAFEARFGPVEGAQKYGAALRKSLGRLSAFVDELKAYGDPGLGAWTELEPGTLWREACEERQVHGGRVVELHLPEAGPLPRIRGDAPSLRALFVLFMDLACLRGNPRPTLGLEPGQAGGRPALRGRVELPWAGEDLDPGRVFEPFYLRFEGIGRLALPLALRRIEAHGGSLRAEGRPAGGMDLVFTVPAI